MVPKGVMALTGDIQISNEYYYLGLELEALIKRLKEKGAKVGDKKAELVER